MDDKQEISDRSEKPNGSPLGGRGPGWLIALGRVVNFVSSPRIRYRVAHKLEGVVPLCLGLAVILLGLIFLSSSGAPGVHSGVFRQTRANRSTGADPTAVYQLGTPAVSAAEAYSRHQVRPTFDPAAFKIAVPVVVPEAEAAQVPPASPQQAVSPSPQQPPAPAAHQPNIKPAALTPLDLFLGTRKQLDAAAQPAAEDSSAISFRLEGPTLFVLESAIPLIVDIFSQRMIRYLGILERRELSRHYSEQEMQRHIVKSLEWRMKGILAETTTHIRSDGFIVSGKINLGSRHLWLFAHVNVSVVDEKPYLSMVKLKLGKEEVPVEVLHRLEERINQSIIELRSPLRIKKFWLNDGWVFISVTLA